MYVYFNGQTLSGVFVTVFFYFKVFGVKNAKIDFLKNKMVLKVIFIKLTFMWLRNWSVRLEKH